MKTFLKIAAFTAITFSPVMAYAQVAIPPMKMGEMTCPMSQEMGTMQRSMSDMSKELSVIAEGTRDPVKKKQIMDMHEKMAAMVVHMSKMSDGMDIMAGNKGDAARH